MNLTGAVDPWFGHWQKDSPVVPDFTKLGGKPPKKLKEEEANVPTRD